jgi:hypothetical protein
MSQAVQSKPKRNGARSRRFNKPSWWKVGSTETRRVPKLAIAIDYGFAALALCDLFRLDGNS